MGYLREAFYKNAAGHKITFDVLLHAASCYAPFEDYAAAHGLIEGTRKGAAATAIAKQYRTFGTVERPPDFA
jgi:hypothetical protein